MTDVFMLEAALVIVIFLIVSAGIFLLGIKVGEEKVRNEQANNESHDENEWK